MDVLEAPVPVMLGLTMDQFATFDYTEIQSRMWVLIDEERIEIEGSGLDDNEEYSYMVDKCKCRYIYEPHLGGLKDKLK